MEFNGLNIIATAKVNDGYNGHIANIGIALIGNAVVCVTKYGGYYRAGTPDVVDESEAIWIINNHPSADHIRVDSLFNIGWENNNN